MKKVLVFFLVTVVAVVVYYKLSYPSFNYKYRMTVEVETPEGVKSGSSVVEVHTDQWPEWMRNLAGGHTESSRASGEAVVVDLDENGVLFVPFMGTYATRIYPLVFTGHDYGWREPGGIPEYVTATNFKSLIPRDHYPMLVQFKNLNDPASIDKILPDNLADSFGVGIHLKSITVESTTDSIEWKIDKTLKWLNELDGKYLPENTSSHKVSLRLHGGNFKITGE